MSLHRFLDSPVWIAAGWTMLHLLWIGAVAWPVIGVLRRLLRSSRPEIRHGVAVTCLLTFSVAPMVLYATLYRPAPKVVAIPLPAGLVVDSSEQVKLPPPSLTSPDSRRIDLRTIVPTAPAGSRFDEVVGYLPGFWLVGSMVTLAMIAAGLVGVEGLRRSSRPIETGEIADRCRVLAVRLGIARRVVVAACDRIAMPVLIGIVRPMILLPPAVMIGWDVDQLEMALLHELAHIRRHDNLVTILQRLAESLLFFHPMTWWLSGWIGLERELCCDRLVIEHTGRPREYAQMLAALAGAEAPSMAMAMARRPLATRIRRILDMEDRSMKWTLTEGLGLFAAAVVGVAFTWAVHAGEPARPNPQEDALGILKRLAQGIVATPDSPQGYEFKGHALIRVAQAQVKIGDRGAARETLRLLDRMAEPPSSKPGAKVDVRAWERFGALIESAEVRRNAGDQDGARAALDRAARFLDAMDHGAVRGAIDRVGDAIAAQVASGKSDAMDEEDAIVGGAATELIDQYLALGDMERARVRIRRLVVDIGSSRGPMRAAFLVTLGGYLVKAGDPAGGRALIERAREAAIAMPDPKARAFVLPIVAEAMFEAGEFDGALAMLPEMGPDAKSDAIRRILGNLSTADPGAGVLDLAGIAIKIGSPWLAPKDPAAARAALPRLADAVRASGGAKEKARTLASIAYLQARAGDIAGALITARSIPALRRSDYPGPSDGFYDAVKPVAFALIAGARATAGDRAGAAETLAEAAALARAIAADDQNLIAQIVLARKWVECGRPETAKATVAAVVPLSLAQPEPRRSRVLGMLAEDQAQAGDREGARTTMEAIRAYPGLEKSRALTVLAVSCERAGDAPGAAEFRRRAASCLEWRGPEKSLPGKVAGPRHIGPDTFIDFDLELDPRAVAVHREMMLRSALANQGDVEAAVRSVQALPPVRRDQALPQVIDLLARRGDLTRALDLAASVESPDARLVSFVQLAHAIPEGPARK